MIVKQTTGNVYDSKNFDSYPNYYAILVDKKTIELNRKKDKEGLENIYIKYTVNDLLLIYNNDKENISNHQGGYKIVYGHFYNNQNYFLFKKLHNDKIVGYNVQKCQKAELWHNKLNKLYISNYLNEVKNTAFWLNSQKNEETQQSYTPAKIGYLYYDYTIEFPTDINNKMNIDYANEILSLSIISNKIITL